MIPSIILGGPHEVDHIWTVHDPSSGLCGNNPTPYNILKQILTIETIGPISVAGKATLVAQFLLPNSKTPNWMIIYNHPNHRDWKTNPHRGPQIQRFRLAYINATFPPSTRIWKRTLVIIPHVIRQEALSVPSSLLLSAENDFQWCWVVPNANSFPRFRFPSNHFPRILQKTADSNLEVENQFLQSIHTQDKNVSSQQTIRRKSWIIIFHGKWDSQGNKMMQNHGKAFLHISGIHGQKQKL